MLRLQSRDSTLGVVKRQCRLYSHRHSFKSPLKSSFLIDGGELIFQGLTRRGTVEDLKVRGSVEPKHDVQPRLFVSMQRCEIEPIWRSRLTFSTHFAFNTLIETSVEERKLCLRTTRSAASSQANISPSTVCRNASGQASTV